MKGEGYTNEDKEALQFVVQGHLRSVFHELEYLLSLLLHQKNLGRLQMATPGRMEIMHSICQTPDESVNKRVSAPRFSGSTWKGMNLQIRRLMMEGVEMGFSLA